MWSGTVAAFISLAKSGSLTALLRRSMLAEGKTVSPYEENAWDQSLPAVAEMLDGKGFDAHEIHILLEVALPGTSARADVVLIGMAPDGARGAVVIELKQWYSPTVRGAAAEMVDLGDDYCTLHPCSQVQGYRDYLRLYHAALIDRMPASQVHGCAFLHNMADVSPLAHGCGADAEARNRALVADCSAFGKFDQETLAAYLRARIPHPPDAEYAAEFRRLERRPSQALAQTFRDIVNSHRNPWVLLDAQREVMSAIEAHLKAIHAGSAPPRQVLIVTGDPGSGKTVLALSTLLKAVGDYRLVNSLLVTTSSAQRTSIEGELTIAKGEHLPPTRKLSKNPVLKATDLRIKVKQHTGKKNSGMDDEAWNNYCAHWHGRHRPAASAIPPYDVLVVDEAQGLVCPEKQYVDGAPANSWRRSYGPQPWHIMMQAKLSIFFMDPDQGYRQVESTIPEDIEAAAALEDIPCTVLKLGDEQFRALGGRRYVTWLNHLFGFEDEALPALTPAERSLLQEVFAIVDDPRHMTAHLRSRYDAGDRSCRLLAGYAWEWVSKDDKRSIDSHEGLCIPGRQAPDIAFRWAYADAQRDFNLGTGPYNNALTLLGSDSYPAAAGYPLTVRGRDINHIGVLWGADLVWRNGRWQGNPELIFGSDMPQLRVAARTELEQSISDGPGMQALIRALAGAYRILLTRGMQSVRLWIEDEETAAHVRTQWQRYLATADHHASEIDTTQAHAAVRR